jgi:hypothetical protein
MSSKGSPVINLVSSDSEDGYSKEKTQPPRRRRTLFTKGSLRRKSEVTNSVFEKSESAGAESDEDVSMHGVIESVERSNKKATVRHTKHEDNIADDELEKDDVVPGKPKGRLWLKEIRSK